MLSRPNNKDCHISFCMEAIMQKCINVALNHIHTRPHTHTSYYLGHFISATGGQKAIRLTALRSKSFEATQNFNIRNIYSSLVSWVVELPPLIRSVNQTSFRLLHMGEDPPLFTEIPRLLVACMLIYMSKLITSTSSDNTESK